jgi:hypothetical protein
VRLNSHPYVVTGVTPPGFYGTDVGLPADVYIPMMMKAYITPSWDGLMDRMDHWCNLVARLRPDMDIVRAQRWRILLLTVVLTLLCGIAFGLLPAWQSVWMDVSGALKAEASLGHTSGRLWIRRVLVAGQIVFSLVLLSTAMLFARSLQNLQSLNPGFRTDHLLIFKVDAG